MLRRLLLAAATAAACLISAPEAIAAEPGIVLGGSQFNDARAVADVARPPFPEALYAAGAKGSFDAVGVHTDTACGIASADLAITKSAGAAHEARARTGSAATADRRDRLAQRIVVPAGFFSVLGVAVAGLGLAIWAAYRDHTWLVVVGALLGGVGYALSGRRWLGTYRSQPAAHARGESVAVLAGTAVVALAGLVVLVVSR